MAGSESRSLTCQAGVRIRSVGQAQCRTGVRVILALDCRTWTLPDSCAMQIKPFRIEQYFGKYEFTAK